MAKPANHAAVTPFAASSATSLATTTEPATAFAAAAVAATLATTSCVTALATAAVTTAATLATRATISAAAICRDMGRRAAPVDGRNGRHGCACWQRIQHHSLPQE